MEPGSCRAPYAAVVRAAPEPESEPESQPESTWRETAYDWAPVVAVAAVGAVGLGLEHPWTQGRATLTLMALLTALPLAGRRPHPVAAGLALSLVLSIQTHALGQGLHFGSFCAVLIAMFSLARHVGPRARSAAGALALGAGVVVAQVAELAAAPRDVVFPLFYLTGTWLLGRGIRGLHDQAQRLSELNRVREAEQESRARLAVANERLALARDLHDLIGHTVTLMVVQAGAARETLRSDPDATARSLVEIQDAGRRGLTELRHLVETMREPDEPAPSPGLDGLAALRASLLASGLTVEVDCSGELESVPVTTGQTAYRVVQEALTNVLRHSAAERASVSLRARSGELCIEVRDAGPPRQPTTASAGHGLRGMQERLHLLGGQVECGPSSDGGFRVVATLPTRIPA